MMRTAVIQKFGIVAMVGMMTVFLLAGCSGGNQGELDGRNIHVIAREDGSGTRGAFVELFDIVWKGDNDARRDETTKEAIIANSTNIILTNVAGDLAAIGYVSLGSLNDAIKPLRIDGADVSEENIRSGAYKIQRPFNIVTTGEESTLTKDFIDFILSTEGQAIVSDGYVRVVDNPVSFEGSNPSGKIVVAGSSSVTPVMEKLAEAYQKANKNGKIEIQMSDSTTGVLSTIDGTCEIGMVSREIKPEEAEQVKTTKIAIDGIAVIVNKENPIQEMSSADVKDVYTGVKTKWSIQQ